MRVLLNIIIFIVLLGSCVNPIIGQQNPIYTQYNLNKFAYNPAVAGIQPCGEFITGNRRQWVGFEGAPNTYFASFNTRIGKKDKYPKNFHGFGFSIISETYGFSNHLYLKGAYAYNIKLSRNYRVGVGAFLGVQRLSQNYFSIRMANKNIDPALNKEKSESYIFPEISPAGFIYNKNFYAGLTIAQIYPERIRTFGTKENRLSTHYNFMSGYRLRGRTWHYIPSILFNFSPFISPTMDITLTFDYKQQFSFALGSKYLNSGYVVVQFQILKTISLGYSYEYALNEFNAVSPNSHEIVINIKSCTTEKKIEKFFCPAYQ